jgi:hypothetical protein
VISWLIVGFRSRTEGKTLDNRKRYNELESARWTIFSIIKFKAGSIPFFRHRGPTYPGHYDDEMVVDV